MDNTRDTVLKTLLKTNEKKDKCTAISSGWKLINIHLLRPWSTCKVLVSLEQR